VKSKVISQNQAERIARQLRAKGKKIAFTNGTFDILHLGHVQYLQKARTTADVLFVGVNTDRSVKTYKEPGRPVNPENDRVHVLAALECVNYAVLFDEPTPLNLINRIKPNVLVKGADWKKSQVAGAKEVESWGGKVRLISLTKGRSTTNVIQKVLALRKK
jgi:rfaE bifunctional protein nucleotidyltransferase chain/domain